MTFQEVCRKYNKLVKEMRQAAEANSWEELLSLDKTALPLEQALIQQFPTRSGEELDDTSRILIAEVLTDQAVINQLVGARQAELKSHLITDTTIQKLGKFYGV